MSFLELFERWKIPSWMPVRWPHMVMDWLFYDVLAALYDDLLLFPKAYMSGKPMPEGGIIVIPSNGDDFKVYDYRDYLEQPLQDTETIVITGCGSSRVGSIAFGRTVAKALDKPVASLIAGYGTRDLFGEMMSGAFIFFPWNWMLQGCHAQLFRLLGTGHHPWLGLKTYQFTYAVPEAAALHQLLLRHPGHFKTIVGHSKGNFAIAAALHALKFSLDEVSEAEVLEKFGLSKKENATNVSKTGHKPESKNQMDIFTFGCIVSLPHAYGKTKTHVYPSHQYVGWADVLGFFGSGPPTIWKMYLDGNVIKDVSKEGTVIAGEMDEKKIVRRPKFPFIVGHNVVTRNVLYPGYYWRMPVDQILEQHKTQKSKTQKSKTQKPKTQKPKTQKGSDPTVVPPATV